MRTTRKLLSALAACTVALTLPAVSASAAPPAALVTWYNTTNEAGVMNGLLNASKLLGSTATMQSGCAGLVHYSSMALGKSIPPNPAFAFHWAAAMVYYQVGGTLCVKVFTADSNDTDMANAVVNDIQQGNNELSLVEKLI